MKEGASNVGDRISSKFAMHDLIWKTAKWVIAMRGRVLIELTVHYITSICACRDCEIVLDRPGSKRSLPGTPVRLPTAKRKRLAMIK